MMENTVRPRHQTGQAETPQVKEMAVFKKSVMAFGCGGKIVYRKTSGRSHEMLAMLESLAAPYSFPCVVILNDKACRKRHS